MIIPIIIVIVIIGIAVVIVTITEPAAVKRAVGRRGLRGPRGFRDFGIIHMSLLGWLGLGWLKMVVYIP